MSFSVDQFMQVQCKFFLTSEPEFSDSIHTNSERVRLCTSVDLDANSTLIVMICSNHATNNHIVAYYTESKSSTKLILSPSSPNDETTPFQPKYDSNDRRVSTQLIFDQPIVVADQQQPGELPQHSSNNRCSGSSTPKVIVKQIYYHYHNEDIAAVCLSDTGNKLALISASSTIYILPIKKIILNLQTQLSRSSSEVSKCPYDAFILDCCTIDTPVAIAYWENLEADNKSTLVVASESGELSFISVDENKELSRSNVNERVSSMVIVRDRFSHSVLITCASFRQYRFALEIVESDDSGVETTQTFSNPHNSQISTDEYIYLERDLVPSWNRKPIPIKLHNSSLSNAGSATANTRLPLLGRAGSQIGRLLNGLTSRERNTPSIFYHPESSMFSVVDTLSFSAKSPSTNNQKQNSDQRLLRFFSTKQFYYRPQKPILVCRLTSLEPDELITHVVLTDRFLAIATDKNRCLVNSKNCCNLKNADTILELDPLVKEVTFINDERILLLLKSPVSNDKNNIIDSFLLVTNKAIFSIEARQSSRDMFINLIDTHLHLKEDRIKHDRSDDMVFGLLHKRESAHIDSYRAERKNSDTNLMVKSFLSNRDEVYERINYDSRAFSALFKLELNSLYEAYGDRLLMRGQFELANRFFQMAKFGHTKTLGKYIRLGAYKKTIDYINNVLRNENETLNEKERTDLAKVAYECLGYITSPEVTRALVKDLSLTSEYLSSKDLNNARKYSSAALRQFESFRQLVVNQHQKQQEANGASSQEFESAKIFTEQQKRSIESIFIEFLNACLDDDSIEDSCWLWFYYVNFYLNYVSSIDELERDIIKLLDSSSNDCYLPVTFYKALYRDATNSAVVFKTESIAGTPLEKMEKIYNLSELFENEFLMKLLDRTLDLVPQTVNLDALRDYLGVNGLSERTRIKCMVN